MTTFDLPTSGTTPKFSTKRALDNEVNRVLSEVTAARIAGDSANSEGLYFAGPWDASTGAFPLVRELGGAVQNGDVFDVSVAGTVDGVTFAVGERITALSNAPSSTTYAANWYQASTITALGPITARVARLESAITYDTQVSAIAETATLPLDSIVTIAGSLFKVVASGGDISGTSNEYLDLNKRTYEAVDTVYSILPDGSIWAFNGLEYRKDTSATGSSSATNDLGIDGWVPHSVAYPEHYGALGDGVALDTVAGVAWAANATGEIELRHGSSYLFGTEIVIPANVHIQGNRATVTANGAFDLFQFTDGGSITNAKLIGPTAAGSFEAGSWGVACRGTNNHPAAPTYVQAPDVIGCEISGFGEYGVRFDYCKRGLVTGNLIINCGYAGVGGISCEDMVVTGNIIEDITPGSAVGDAYGVFIDRANGLSETSDPRSYRCIISDNVINRVVANSGNNGQGIDTHAGVEFSITGNIIGACERGIFVTSSLIGTLGEQLGPKRCVVDGNIINGDVGYGIMVNGAKVSGVATDWAEGCIVTNNTIQGYGVAGDALVGSIQLQFTKGTIVSGNVLKNPHCNGINLNSPNLGFNVSGNHIIDPWDDSYSSPNCIRVGANDNLGLIQGNVFEYADGGLGTYVAKNALRIESGKTGLDIEIGRNYFLGIDADHLTLLSLTTTGVSYSGCSEQVGTAAVNITSGGSTGLTAVTFPKRMPYTPKIMLTAEFQSGTREKLLLSSGTVSATGFTCYAESPTTFGTTKAVNITWKAS